MKRDAAGRRQPWWKLERLEQVALMLGALVGLAADAPLVWLLGEAHRTSHTDLATAEVLYPTELLVVWLSGAIVGGFAAAGLVRRICHAGLTLASHSLRLLAGTVLIVLVSPLPLALIALLVTRRPETFSLYYISSGGLIGWQPGVITYVFLYTFRVLEQKRESA